MFGFLRLDLVAGGSPVNFDRGCKRFKLFLRGITPTVAGNQDPLGVSDQPKCRCKLSLAKPSTKNNNVRDVTHFYLANIYFRPLG